MGWFWDKKPVDRHVFCRELRVKVIFYRDVRHLRQQFRALGGNLRKADRCKGFWEAKTNTIHTIKDQRVLGHECFHALDLIGVHE